MSDFACFGEYFQCFGGAGVSNLGHFRALDPALHVRAHSANGSRAHSATPAGWAREIGRLGSRKSWKYKETCYFQGFCKIWVQVLKSVFTYRPAGLAGSISESREPSQPMRPAGWARGPAGWARLATGRLGSRRKKTCSNPENRCSLFSFSTMQSQFLVILGPKTRQIALPFDLDHASVSASLEDHLLLEQLIRAFMLSG